MRKQDLPDGYFSSNILMNGMVYRQFSRYKVNAWRGESSSSGKGMAMYGRGIYSTTDRSYAKNFGTIRRVTSEEMPFKPIRFKDGLAFSQWEHDLAIKYGKDWLASMGYAEGFIRRMGFDGVTIGTGREMIIVKYTDVT